MVYVTAFKENASLKVAIAYRIGVSDIENTVSIKLAKRIHKCVSNRPSACEVRFIKRNCLIKKRQIVAKKLGKVDIIDFGRRKWQSLLQGELKDRRNRIARS